VLQRAVRGAPGSALLRRAARAAAPAGARLTLRLVGAGEARRLNRCYRRRDYATNVLAFDYGAGAGDIVLCHPLIAREARAGSKTLGAHYSHLVVHAVLHLRGYDHLRAREAARMERAETRVLARLGYPDPYAVEWRRRSPRRR
jgi:probable rRNA maturation factor